MIGLPGEKGSMGPPGIPGKPGLSGDLGLLDYCISHGYFHCILSIQSFPYLNFMQFKSPTSGHLPLSFTPASGAKHSCKDFLIGSHLDLSPFFLADLTLGVYMFTEVS